VYVRRPAWMRQSAIINSRTVESVDHTEGHWVGAAPLSHYCIYYVYTIDREFEFYDFFSFLKYNEFYEFFSVEKIRKKFVILQIVDV